jgi:hypothetical protein
MSPLVLALDKSTRKEALRIMFRGRRRVRFDATNISTLYLEAHNHILDHIKNLTIPPKELLAFKPSENLRVKKSKGSIVFPGLVRLSSNMFFKSSSHYDFAIDTQPLSFTMAHLHTTFRHYLPRKKITPQQFMNIEHPSEVLIKYKLIRRCTSETVSSSPIHSSPQRVIARANPMRVI